MDDPDHRTIWCGNLSEKITEDLLYELFLQGGPLEKVTIPKDRNGKNRMFAFITYKHKCSVQYAMELFANTTLFNRPLSLKLRETVQMPQEAQICMHNNFQTQQNMNQLLQYGNQMLLGNMGFMNNMGMNMYNMYPNNQFMMTNQVGYYQQGGSNFQNQQGVPNFPNQLGGMNFQNQQGGSNFQNQQGGPNYQNEERRNNRPHPYYGNNRKERNHDRDRDRDRDRDSREHDRDRDRGHNRDRDNRDDQDNRYNVRSHKSKQSSHGSTKYNGRRSYR